MGLSWLIARRFNRGKKQNRYIDFVSRTSTLGIALGCFVLIVLLSVMNGFERELKNSLLALIPHAELEAVDAEGIRNWQAMAGQLRAHDQVTRVLGVNKVTAMLQRGKVARAAQLTALDPAEAKQSPLARVVPPMLWDGLNAQADGIIIGQSLAQQLGVVPGDKIKALLPQQSVQGRMLAPRYSWFTLVGLVSSGGQNDQMMGFIQLDKGAELLNVPSGARGLVLYFSDPFLAPRLVRSLGYSLPQQLYLSDWTRTHGHVYQDIRLVRAVVYIVLVLVIAVACFNILSSLVMAVKEKQQEVAMLQTMGAGQGLILRIFIWQGALSGIIGTLAGCALGMLVAPNLSRGVSALEDLLGRPLLSGDVYFIDFLPSQLMFSDVLVVGLVSLVLSVAAALYPALKAARQSPLKGLV